MLQKIIGKQARQPQGLLGRLMGKIMSKRNYFMNMSTIELMDIQPSDKILEIGFGNGKYLGTAVKLASKGFVAGIDFSETMVKEAINRNRKLIDSDKAMIKYGRIEEIPFEREMFDKVYTVNTIYFWPDPKLNIKEVLRVMKPGGSLIVTFRAEIEFENYIGRKPGFRYYKDQDVINLLLEAGMHNVSLTANKDNYAGYSCIKGYKV